MITFNGTTWTDPGETAALITLLQERHRGEDIAKPECRKCKNRTTFIWEPAKIRRELLPAYLYDEEHNPVACEWPPEYGDIRRITFKKKGVEMLIALMKPAFFPTDDAVLIPVSVCHKCSAAVAGASASRDQPGAFDLLLKEVDGFALTEKERAEYKTVFTAAFRKYGTQIDEKNQDAEKKKRRYQPASKGASA